MKTQQAAPIRGDHQVGIWKVKKDYNAETRAAYEAKIAADWALHEAFQKAR